MEATTPEIVGEFQRFQTLRNNSQQNGTTRNNMQQGVQTDATCNIQHCCAVCSGLYVPVHFFPLPLIFTLVAASIPHFLTLAIMTIFMCFLPTKLVAFVFISRSRSFSVIHVNVDIKIWSKERLGFVVFVGMRFTSETCGCLKCKILLRLTRMGGRWDVLTDDFLRTKISSMHR